MSTGLVIVGFVIAIASTITNIILSQRNKENETPEERREIGEFSNTSQAEGVVIPLVFGTGILTGNIIWWDAIKNNGAENAYYSFSFWQVVCMGGVQLRKVFRTGSSPVKTETTNDPGAEDSILINVLDDLEKVTLLGFDPVIQRAYYFFGGLFNSNISMDSVGTEIRQQLPGGGFFVGNLNSIAHIITKFYIDMEEFQTVMPTYKYIVSHYKVYYDDIIDDDNNITGSNPIEVIRILLQDVASGLGLADDKINIDNFDEAADYFATKKYGLNFIVKDSKAIKEIIFQIQSWTNCFLVKDSLDRYNIKILKDSDINTPRTTIQDEDMISFSIHRKSWKDTFNAFTGNYNDNYYPLTQAAQENYGYGETRSIGLRNEANIAMTGTVRHKIIDLTCFSSKVNAATRLNEIMKQESYPFATGQLTTNLSFTNIVLGDVIIIDSDEYEITAFYRVMGIDISQIDKNKLMFDIVELKEILSTSSTIEVGNSEGQGTKATVPANKENIVFTQFSPTSEPIEFTIQNKNNLAAYWGINQMQSGKLTYSEDFTITDDNRIQLDEIIFDSDIINNASGLLNIDIHERYTTES